MSSYFILENSLIHKPTNSAPLCMQSHRWALPSENLSSLISGYHSVFMWQSLSLSFSLSRKFWTWRRNKEMAWHHWQLYWLLTLSELVKILWHGGDIFFLPGVILCQIVVQRYADVMSYFLTDEWSAASEMSALKGSPPETPASKLKWNGLILSTPSPW